MAKKGEPLPASQLVEELGEYMNALLDKISALDGLRMTDHDALENIFVLVIKLTNIANKSQALVIAHEHEIKALRADLNVALEANKTTLTLLNPVFKAFNQAREEGKL